MKTYPKISVILPFHNPGERFNASIKSILNQTYQNLELILVNNNSDTESTVLAKNFSKKETRIIYLEEARQGVVFATEKGMHNARGKYLSRMDADDIAYPEKLQKQISYLEEHPEIDLVACRVKYIPNDMNSEGFAYYVDWSNSILTHEQIFINRFVESPIVNPSILFRKKLLDTHDLYREGDFPEDYELFLRWLQEGVKMSKLPEVLFEWHDGNNRLTRTDTRYSMDAFFKIKSQYIFYTLKELNPKHPHVAIWGAGRRSRKRLQYLKELGLKIDLYIDIKPNKKLDVPCISYKDLRPGNEDFILSVVSSRGAREKIEKELLENDYVPGKHFLIIA